MLDRSHGREPAHPAPDPPRVLDFSRIDFPSPKANSIQTFNTCWEMARAGAEVHLVVRSLLHSRRDCFAYYGLPEQARLRLVSLSLPVASEFNSWKGKYFSAYVHAFLRRHARGTTWLMTRDPAGLELLQLVRSLRHAPSLRYLFEVHDLSFLTRASHQAERGLSLDDPEVRDPVERRRRLESDVYAFVDGLVCTSSATRDLLDQHFPGHAPACVVPNGTRIPRDAAGRPDVRATLDDSRRDLDLLYVGQLDAWKGVDGLVRALERLPGRRLTIVGGNDETDGARLRALAAAAGVGERIEFVGQVPPHAVRDFLERARVGVVPLPHSGFVEAARFTSPLELFELMRSGVPIVAPDLPSVRELVTDGEHALLVPPDDPAALARGIDRLLCDRELAGRLVRAAAARVLQFTWEARARRVVDFAASLQVTSPVRGA